MPSWLWPILYPTSEWNNCFIKLSALLYLEIIHPMQIRRTTLSWSGTSCKKARQVGPRCFVLTMLPQKSLASLAGFCATECYQKGWKLSSVRLWLKLKKGESNIIPRLRRRKRVHDRRWNWSLFAKFNFILEDLYRSRSPKCRQAEPHTHIGKQRKPMNWFSRSYYRTRWRPYYK